jgi:hypothetical protein
MTSTKEVIRLMAEVKQNIIDYLTEEIGINNAALKHYDDTNDPLKNKDVSDEVQKIREIEAVKLRDRIHQLSTYIAVIKRMP